MGERSATKIPKESGGSGEASSLDRFHPAVRQWFCESFDAPTLAQTCAWPFIFDRRSTLLLAPTGSGKTLAAFLVAIDRILFDTFEKRSASGTDSPTTRSGVRVLYISPLKALGVDIERNLKVPIAGVLSIADKSGIPHHVPRVGVRSGDTPPDERRRLHREPPDILITTPESLYLILTSRAREMLASVDTVIIDEIHSLVGNKRGSHLFLSLERLEDLRLREGLGAGCGRMQRIGLSATQRPLEEIARLLGGHEILGSGSDSGSTSSEATIRPRPVEVVDAGSSRGLDLKVEVPVEDMTRLTETDQPAGSDGAIPSIWPSLHHRLVELIRSHRSTMIFVNSRRLAERVATAINELAGEEIALAHHGSLAKESRRIVEERLKRGSLPAIVATSSLELGIDMGAVDFVIQIEAPPSIASGIQRIGRAGHQVGARSCGVIFPKARGDLLACAAAAGRMLGGEVEEMFYPRNPLDVLAQQLVAMVALEPMSVEELYRTVRRAAPFADLPRSSFEGVLDLLTGRYPTSDFSELRPRLTWDRIEGEVSPRRGAQRVAITNAGTIPDRGLYGVFVADGSAGRVGELDEEMVFETRPGDVFRLGASSWRAVEISHDRVLVTPAPGEPGRLPFWRGDGAGRPVEFGRAIGALTRRLLSLPREDAQKLLREEHSLDVRAARNLVSYLLDQKEGTGEVPSDRTVVVENFLDEVGDWRIAILTPFGARVHAPWAIAVGRKLRASGVSDFDRVWSEDGILFRLSEAESLPPLSDLIPTSDEVEDLVVSELGSTPLFAARFRENAARALLLPRRRPGHRAPLWLQRRRSANLLAAASGFPDFPILLETYRECLLDVFDLRSLRHILDDCEKRVIRVHSVRTRSASPFASFLLFHFTGSFLYDGDAPLAERRAAKLSLDHSQLRELLGEAELRELLDAETIDEVQLERQRRTSGHRIKHRDDLHDLLLELGDLRQDEIADRVDPESVSESSCRGWIEELLESRRILEVRIGGEMRFVAAEDASRFRDALAVDLPEGLPDAFLQSLADPLGDLILRYARTHGPFVADDVARRFDLGVAPVVAFLERLEQASRLVEGGFLPEGRGREWCDPQILRRIKRRSMAKLRKEIEPVHPSALARFLVGWQGLDRKAHGLDGLLDVIEQLQGIALPASTLEREILPARVNDYRESDLDELCTAGEVVWRGHESLGNSDGRIALYLTDHLGELCPAPTPPEDDLALRIRELLLDRGAILFDELVRTLGGFPPDLVQTLWRLVWAGVVTNDTLAPLRSLRRAADQTKLHSSRSRRVSTYRSRRRQRPSGSEGRWSILPGGVEDHTVTQRQTAVANQLLDRYGVLAREMVLAEKTPGGFSGIYPVLRAMEEAGKVRRGYFVAGLGAAQFARFGADDQLRAVDRDSSTADEEILLAATDPANPYGAAVRWPESQDGSRPRRVPGAKVFLVKGVLAAYFGPSERDLLTFVQEDDPATVAQIEDRIAQVLAEPAVRGETVLIARIDGVAPDDSSLGKRLLAHGFFATSRGYILRAAR